MAIIRLPMLASKVDRRAPDNTMMELAREELLKDVEEERTDRATGSTTCPVCQAVLPVYEGFLTWCDACEWNLETQEAITSPSTLDRFYGSLGRRLGQRLFEEMTQGSSAPPSMSWARVLCLVLATMVLTLSIGLALLSPWLLLITWPNFLTIWAAPTLLGVAWLARPRFGKLPTDGLGKDKIPSLYRLVDQVVQALGTKPPDIIVINEDFNASFGRAGIRRKRVLRLGLPLVSILDEDETVALISHELAHGVNGDPTRGFLVGLALNTLATWHWLLEARHANLDDVSILEVPVVLLLSALAHLCYLAFVILFRLLYRDSQRAEYQADYLAASVSGTDAMLSTLQKLHLYGIYTYTVQRTALNPSSQATSFFAEFKRQIANVPPRELERIRRVGLRDLSSLDSSHPPTTYRMQFLRAHFVANPKVEFSPSDFAELQRELRSIENRIQKRLVDSLQSSLYYG